MMYLSKGIECKVKGKRGFFIRHYGRPIELVGEEVLVWKRGRSGFAYTKNPTEVNAVKKLVKRGLAICKDGHTEPDKYDALCWCAIYANPRYKFDIRSSNKPEKRILTWLRKAEQNLSFSELVCLEDKGIDPKPNLLSRKNSSRLMKIIYPELISMAGDLEVRMKHSPVRKQTVDAVMKLLRRKRVIIM